MLKCGRNLLGCFKTLAVFTLAAVTGLSTAVRAGAQTTQSPSSYNFGNVAILETSLPEKITVKNTGAAAITINSYSVTGGPYAISTGNSTCGHPGSLGAGASCTVAVTVEPTALGAAPAGTLTLNTTASNSPQHVTFSATGVEPVTLSSAGLAFGSVVVGATSGNLSVILANNQPTSVTISAISVTVGNGFAIAGATTCSVNGQLTARSSCNIALNFTPGALGAAPSSTLSVTTTQSGTPLTIPLTGTGIAPTLISPASIAFGNQVVGQTSLIKSFTFKNAQSTPLSISSIVAPPGGFAIDPSTSCANPGSLGAGATCSVGVTFTPTASGPAPAGSVIVTTNASNSPQSVPVTGSGAAPVSFSTATIHFGNVALNQTSAIQTVTVTNNQTTQTVSFSPISVTGDSQFTLDPSSTCSPGTPLALSGAPGSSCTLAFTFTPTSAGTQPSGTTNIGFNASNAPMTVTLSGVGVQATTVSPTSMGFGTVVVNTQSPAKTIRVNNLQAATLSLTQLVFNGPFILDTSANTTCPMAGGTVSGTLAANSSCAIGIIFAPTAAGSTSGGQVTVISSSPSGPMVVSLAGAGVNAVSFGPTALNFGNVPINIASAPSNLNITNNQSANLNFTSITVPAPYSISVGTTTCVVGTPVLPGGKCTVSVTVDPTAIGAVAASALTLIDDAPSSPQTASLVATGVPQVQINPTTIGFGTLVVNQENTGTTTLTNFLSTPIVIDSIASFTAPYSLDTTVVTTCPLAPEALAAGQKCKIGIDVTPTAIGSLPGSATLIYNVSGSPTMVDLPIAMTGTAYRPVAILPSPVSFPTAFVGVPTAVVPVKVKNLQSVPLTISAITVGGTDPGDFSISGNLCPVAPATLPANSNCIVNMTFTPAASGARSATLSVADDALGSPQTVSLTGDGNAPLKVTPLAVTSYQANVGAISAYQTVTITNQTTNPITLNAFQLNGDFEQTATTCGATLPYVLAGGAFCNVSISFAPTIGGTRGGQLQVIDTAATSPQVINLKGHAYNPLTLSQAGMVYSAQLVGTTSSPAKVMTLINHESESESFSLTPSGPFSATTNCTTGTIAANSSCTLFVDYSPTTVTPPTQSGSITVNDSAPGGSPLVLSLTGTASATNPAAAVAVVSPGAAAGGPAPTIVNVTITGNGWTHFSSSSAITFPVTSNAYASDITVNSFTAVTPNTINASITIAGSPVFGARNIKVVTPLTAGGTETARLDSAFIVSDPTQTYEITSITPAVATQGQGYLGVAPLTVNIVATGTNFVQDTTFANFGDGVTVESLDITGPTTATAVLAISNTTDVGYRSLTMVTGGQVANSVLNNGNPLFYIGPNSAKLTGVTMATVTGGVVTCTATPVSVPQSFAGPICLTATGTHFLQNATGITVTGGVTVGDTIVTSPTTAYSNVIVPAGATIGVDSVTVATGGEISTLGNSFTVTGSTPALIAVTPNAGQQGQSLTVTLTGNSFTAFHSCPGGVLTADFTGVISSPTVNIVSAHVVTIPIVINENAPTGGITANLTCGGAGSATIFPFGFTIQPSSASIVSVTPSSVPQGGQVTLNVTGLNTDWSQANTMSAFYPTPIATPLVNETTILSPTSAQLAISVPTNTPVGTYCFYMATGGQIVSACIQVYANTPTLTMSPANGLVPASGTIPISVSFTGQFTHFSQSGTVPVVSGEGVTLTNFTVNNVVGATGTINISAGAATGTRLITFTTGGEIVTTYFNVTTIPVGIISEEPWNAAQSTTVNVAIVGLNTHFVSGSTQVIFGGPQITVNSVTVTDATHLTARITTSYTPPGGSVTPTPPGWNTVYINDPSEQLLTGFLVDAPATPSLVSACVTADLPACVSHAPQGSGGTNITITGSLTNWVQGSSELVMGAGITVADLVITSPTTATATISVSPTAPVGGNSVIMITPLAGGGFEYDSGIGFSVNPSAVYISDVSLPACQNKDNNATFIADFCNNGTSNIVPVVAQLQTSYLNVTGVGTHWLQGETTMSFGQGVAIDQLTINSPTTATVQITVLSSSPVGFVTATASTDGENASLEQAIDIEEGSPTFLAFSPQGAQQGATLNVEVLGRFTNWSAATPPVAEFNQDITINSVNVVDSETLVLNVTVSPWAYVDYSTPCGHVLTITSGSEQVSSSMIDDNFCVSLGAQEITGVTPNASPQGSSLQVTITGSQTNFLAGQSQVSFGDPGIVAGEPTMVTDTTMVVPVVISTSATPDYHTVTVTTYGQVENQVDAFSVTPSVAQLTEAMPDQAEQGVQNLAVRLIGQYSHFSSSSTATFGAGITVVGTPTFVSATEVDAVIDISPISYVGSRNVTVSTPNVACPPANTVLDSGVTYQGCTGGATHGTEIVNANVFSIIPGPAIITGVSPNTGNEGQEIVFNITGLDTHWQQNFTQFYIAGGGSDITVNDVIINNATSATVDISISPTANAGPRSVYMVTAGESLTDSGAFVVTGGVPAISYLTPNSAQPGTTELQVTVVGNAYTQWSTASGTTVSFGPGITIDSQEVTDASHIVADINIGPTCTSPGVPTGCAQYGYRTVVAQTGAQGLTGNFNVVAPPPPPTPYVWYESPSSGIPGQTMSIYFYGANTEWDPNPTTGTTLTGWDSHNITVNSYQIVSPTEALVNITINSNAPAESMGLTFTTNGTTYNDGCSGCEVDDASFTVVIAQPTLSIVDPGSGLQGAQNITVNILGQFTAFDASTTFSFGGPTSGITTVGSPTILGPTIATQMISIGQETPTGGYSVVATTPDATNPIQQVVGGAGFSVTPSLATILSVMPNTSAQGTQITVNVTGFATHWTPATTFNFGAGIVVTGVTVNSETSATLTLAIPAYAPEGTTYAQAQTSGEVATLNQAFVITAGTPYLLSSGPGSVEQQGAAVFTILAQATTWSAATPPVVSYGGDITLGAVQVTSPTTLTVQGAASATAFPGYRNLTVTTGTQVLSINNAVYISPGPAVINSVTPNTGGQGVTFSNVQINGINTHWVQGTTTLTFPGVLINSFIVNSPTSITANITVDTSSTPGQVNVTATTLGEVATEINAFTITQTQAELAFINPSNLPQGQTQNVTITGIDTSFSASSVVTASNAGITINSVTFNSATSLTANVTVSPTIPLGYKNITVTTGAQIVASNSLFQVTSGPAAISGLNPASGGEGQSVQIVVTGSQTHFAQGATSASFSGGISVTGVTVQSLLQATVNIYIPVNVPLGSYSATLTTGGEVARILNGFTVNTGSPVIANVNPPTGTQGITTNVSLTGGFTSWVQGTSVANFGAGITVNPPLTVNSPTSAVANITISPSATLGSRTVTVTTNAQVASITGGFTVLAGSPNLVTSSPGSGQAGATLNLTITGEYTNFQQAFSTVSVGDGITTNFITVNSPTQITANITIPGNAATGSTYVSVTTLGDTLTLDNAFMVLPGTPVITQINPNVGTTGQTENVTIIGLYTGWVNGTTVANFGGASSGITVNSTTVNSATNLTANITISGTAPLGPVTVTTTTLSEVENVAGGFTIQSATPPSPQVIALSPGAGSYGMPLNGVVNAVFSEPMLRSTISSTTVLFYLTSNPNSGYISVPGTVTLDPTGRIVTFAPSSLLAPNSNYQFQMTGAIQSATGIALSNYSVSISTTSAIATTGPSVVAANPPVSSTVGTNVSVQLEFSADMQQGTESGMTVSTGGNPVTGTYSWNANPYCCGSGWAQPGTVLTFTPAGGLTAATTYTVAWNNTLTDTAGNPAVPGSFTFNTGSGPDTVTNNVGSNFNGLTNVGTNFAPTVTYAKAINPIDIWGGWNSGTLLLYNNDSSKYIEGTVTVAPNGLSATFTPTVPLLPDTYYHVYMAGGYYDADGNYLNGNNFYFTTGTSSDTTPPNVTFVSPANSATAVPLNSQIMVKFSTPINENNTNVITVTPAGGSAIPGTVSLAGDLVTLTFTPTAPLKNSKVYTVSVSGFTDVVGNSGTSFSSTFTTTSSAVLFDVSTGINASGQAILVGDTADPHWDYATYPGISIPAGETDILYPGCDTADYTSNTNLKNCTLPTNAANLPVNFDGQAYTVSSTEADWYGGWVANGPRSSWIAINPLSPSGNAGGFYYTSFTMPSPLPSAQICLVGSFAHDDNGLLAVNGTSIMGDQSTNGGSPAQLNINITAELLPGLNYLNYAPGSTDNTLEGVNLNATIETCGASETGGLSITSATPTNNATNVATSASIVMNFNNALDPATVNATTLPIFDTWNSNYQITGTYALSNNNTTVTFTPTTAFPVNSNIWVGACSGPLDLAGDSLGGCFTQELNFWTGPTVTAAGTGLQVAAYSPLANATNVGLRAPVYVTFNRSINPYSINNSDFGLYDGEGVSSGYSQNSPWCDTNAWTHSQDDTTFYWTCYPLPSSAEMTMVLNNGISDVQGDTLTPFTSSFTTAPYDSNVNGTIIGTRPGNGASGVDPNLSLTLFSNLPINASTANSGIQVAQNNVLVPGTATVLDGGYTLEFTPSVPFTNGALIQWWTTGSLFETTYNTPITGISGYFYTVAGTSTAAPTVQVTSPPRYTNPLATNSVFDVQFNTPINPSTIVVSGTPSVYLYDSTTGTNIPVTYSEPQPNEVLMTPTTLPLPSNHYIYVEITTGLQSTTSVPATAVSWYEYTGTATDTTLPIVSSAVPYNGATNVAVNDTPGVIFSKSIDPISVTSTSFQVLKGGTPLAGYFWFNSNDTRVDFVPNSPLPPGASLTISINGITDLEGHPATYSSGFSTGTVTDFTAPSVLFSSVNSNDSIPTNSTIAVTFNEPMDATTFTNGQPGACGNFYIYDELAGSGINCIATTLTWNSSQTIAYLTPTAPLAAGREYQFVVESGTDLAGNVMNTDYFYFYADFTASTVAPTVTAFNPIGGLTGLGTNAIIEAQFSAPIDPNYMSGVTLTYSGGTVPANVYAEAGNTVIQIIPTAPLLPTTTYTMNIVGVKDPAGNGVATVTNSFTTGATYDINSPTVVESVPVNGASVGTNVAPKLVFNKPLNPLTVNASSFRLYLYDTGEWIPTTVTLSTNGLEVTITPQIALLPNTEYYFFGGNGISYDEDGNYYPQANFFFWTTGGTATTAPTVSISPGDTSTGVPVNTVVQVAVSVPVDPTTITQSSITLKHGATPVSGTVTLASSQLLVFTPSTTATSSTQTALGCYNDYQNNIRVLTGYSWSSGNEMTVEQCVSSCSSRGYQYAGVEDANECFCGNNNYSEQGASTSCNMACTGNGAETCGGNGALNVYTAQSEVVPQNLAATTSYTVHVSGFSDANGNAVTPASSSFTTAGTASTSDLVLTSTNVSNAATGVSNTLPLVLVFSNPLDPATVNGNTLQVTVGGCCSQPIAGTLALSNNNMTVTFTPTTGYPVQWYNPPTDTSEVPIYVSTCNGPYDVLGQEAYGGGCGTNLFYFYVNTGGTYTTALQVTGVTPPDLATNVGRDQSVSVTFNNSIENGSANGYNSQLYAGQSLQDDGSYSLSEDNKTLTFNVGALYNNTNYTILLPASGITDMWGNALSQDFVSTFSTMADPATGNGSIISTTPNTSTSSSVPVNSLLTLYLNRQINSSTLPGQLTVTVNGQVYAGTVQSDASGYQVQYTPSTPFPNSAAVQWWFSGNVQDTYGDYFNGASGYFYTVATINPATAEPVIVAVSPTCCSLGDVATNGEVDVQYSQPLNPTTVTTANFFQNTGPAITYTVGLVPSTNNTVVRIKPTTNFNASTQYGFCVNNSVLGANGVTAQSDCWLTYFTTTATTDTTSGTVTVGPPNNSENVGTNAYIRVQFSKPADRTTVNSSTIAITTGGNAIPGSFTYNYSGNDLYGVNFYPLNPLPQSSVIQVAVSGILDYSGNLFSEPTITFTTAAQPDYTNPSVTLDFNSTTYGISTTASFTCLYSEPMDPSSITPGGTYVYSDTAAAQVPVTYTFSADMMSVTMKPISPLLQNSEYYYQCYNAIDLTGNGQNGTYSYFYTGSGPVTTGPTVVGTNPPNGMTNVPINSQNGPWNNTSLGILFSEPISGNSLGQITLTPQGGSPIPIGVNPEDGNYMGWVSLPYPLLPNTQYTFNITGVTDLNGNPMTAPATSTFTTGSGFDWTNAGVTATSPVNGVTTTGVPTSATVTFSEALDPILINPNEIYVRQHNSTGVITPATVSVSPSPTPATPTTVTLNFTAPLLDGTIYDIYYYPNPWWLTNISGINATSNYGILATFTTGTAAAVNGVCGSANTGTFTSVASINPANLCSVGTVSGQTNSGTYSWSCNGNNGGTNASCSATITPSSACLAKPAGLVSWWPANDNATDIVSGNNGALENGATYGLGEVDDAFNLTGNTLQASDQYIQINGGAMPADLEIQSNLTLSAWIYPTAYPVNYGSGAIGFIAGSQNDGTYEGATLYYDARVNPDGNQDSPIGHIGFNLGNGSTWFVQDTQTQVPLNQWTLVTGVATSGQQSQVYFNGVLQPSNSGNYAEVWPGTVSYTNTWFQIGQETNENRPFTGLIDDVQVYNTSLTAAQVLAIYNAGNAGMCP